MKTVHEDQVERYGGDRGLRDRGLFESAAAMPAASFGDQYLHAFPHEMAAAYLLTPARQRQKKGATIDSRQTIWMRFGRAAKPCTPARSGCWS